MNSPRSLAAWLICFSFGGLAAIAQPTPDMEQAVSDQIPTAPDLKPMTDALKLRSETAASVGNDIETADAAVTRLRAQPAASGVQIDSAADFAYAAIDVGQRLISLGKPAAAESFFRAAEESLDTLVKRTADAKAREKAQYLRKLSLIRGNYLNKAAQAKLDIEQALTLLPDDKDLLRARQNLANSNSPVSDLNPRG